MSLPNTAHAIAKSTLFPAELVPGLINLVKGKSSLAKMTGATPLPFNGSTMFTFTMDNEVDIVAEAGAKSAGGAQVAAKNIVPIKVEYGARVSDEFLYAAEEQRLDILRAFSDGFAAKLARGLDIMAMHGVNPRTGSSANSISSNNLDAILTANSHFVTYLGSSSTADENIESAIALIGDDYASTGLIGGATIKAALAALEGEDGRRIYPQLAWGATPNEINGTPVDFNSTVQYNSALARAYVGQWDAFKWGIAKEIPVTVIPYGNPDNDSNAGDLAGHNQVYLRAEAFIGWAFMDGAAFAGVKASS